MNQKINNKEQPDSIDSFMLQLLQNPGDSWSWAHLGELFCLEKRYNDALASLNQAIQLRSNYPWALARRGEVYRLTERYKEALVDFDQAITLNPDYVWAIAHRGAVHFKRSDYHAALNDLDRALTINPDYKWALIYRVDVNIALGQYDKAQEDLNKVGNDEKVIPFQYWEGDIAMVLNFQGKFQESIERCQSLLRTDKQDYMSWYTLAVAETKLYGLEKAKSTLEQAQEALRTATTFDKYALVFYRLGGIEALLEQKGRALEFLERSIKLHHEPGVVVHHDPAWDKFRKDSDFLKLIDN